MSLRCAHAFAIIESALYRLAAIVFSTFAVSAGATWNEGDVAKLQNFNQTDDTLPTADGISPFSFSAYIRNTVSNQTGTVALPPNAGYSPNPITVVSPGLLVGAHYCYAVPYFSLNQLDTAFPNGAYTFNISRTYSSGATTIFAQEVSLTSAAGMPTQVPRIIGNWSGGKLLVTAGNTAFAWEGWASPGSPQSRIEFGLHSTSGAGGANMSPNSTSLTWQGLKANTTYQASLAFLNIEDNQTFIDPNAADPSLGFRAYYATRTSFTVQVLPDPNWPVVGFQPSWPRLLSVAGTSARTVAVGENGRIATLDNATGSWTIQDSVAGKDWNCVIFANNQYLAVGIGGGIRTSPDGLIWTDRASGTTSDLRSVLWTGSQYIAVGNLGRILTSPDGATWTNRNSGTSISFESVAFSGSVYVATGSNGIRISNDSVSWRDPSNGGGASGQAVCWSRNQFLLGSDWGELHKSSDGEAWFRVSSWNGDVTRLLSIGGVSYSLGSRFGTTSLKRSFDGENWTDITPQGSPTLTDMTWTGEALVLLDSDNYILKGSGLKYEFFCFPSSTVSVAENNGPAGISVLRLGPNATSQTVDYSTAPGSAATELDYVGAFGTLTFGAGETVKTLQIQVFDDGLVEDQEDFTVSLENPSGDAALSDLDSLVISIVDDEPRPVLQIQNASYSVAENAGFIDLSIVRSWDVSLPTTVVFTTQAGTAISGLDFQEASGVLSFGPNETLKSVQVGILDNGVFDWPRSFTVKLSNPAAGSSLGNPGSATVNIVNDDPAPPGLIILEAIYGANGVERDVRSYVSANIANDTVNMTAGNSTLGGDPLFGVVKSLYVRYQNAAGHFSRTVREGSKLQIPDNGALRLPMDFAHWATTKFSTAEQLEPAISGELGDPNHNGLPNLLEFALNLDPKAVVSSGLPAVELVSAGSDSHLQLTFNANPEALNLAYIVEVSDDLITWNSGVDHTEQQTPPGLNPVVVIDKVSAGSVNKRFIRLKVIHN